MVADTMDVYVATTGKVRLMDFNPVGGATAPLLFDWEELGYGGFLFVVKLTELKLASQLCTRHHCYYAGDC